MVVLGIESSCDETAAAVLADGRRVLSSVVASQDAIHAPYGGVVPELASRRHLEVIVPVVEKALADAGVRLRELDGVAVTQGPGLVGSLLVGCAVAKSLAYVHRVPLVAVNHLQGHIYATLLTGDPPEHPFLAPVVPGDDREDARAEDRQGGPPSRDQARRPDRGRRRQRPPARRARGGGDRARIASARPAAAPLH